MPILYNLRQTGPDFTFAKWDEDFNFVGSYTLKPDGTRLTCDCPGWPRRQTCKHVRMVSIFALRGAIGTAEFYCYETQTWHTPIQAFGDKPSEPHAEKAAQVADAVGPSIVPPPLPASAPPPRTGIRRI